MLREKASFDHVPFLGQKICGQNAEKWPLNSADKADKRAGECFPTRFQRWYR